MLHCVNSSGNESNITVLERQRARMNSSSININSQEFQIPIPSSFDAISRTLSSPPTLSIPKLKRKPHHHHPPIPTVVGENVQKDKRIKVVPEEEDDDGESKNNTTDANSNNNNKENSAAAAADASSNSKPDYIHVRARRGQATDSHSLAERVRREKISERMKFLQDLVPGCNKITGKAGMLDEIINYVQSLQTQVEFLSMKLATLNPSLDFNIDHLFDKEVFPTCDVNAGFPAMGMMSSEMNNHPYLQFNSQQQIVSYGGLDTGINTSDMGLRRTISAPVSIPETFIDSSSFSNILPSSTCWEGDFQNIYNNLTLDQPRPTSFPSQLFTGLVEASNLKMEI